MRSACRSNGNRLAAVFVAVGLTAVATATAGPVTSIALAAPQIVRRLTKATGPNLLPSMLMGGFLLLLSDVAAQRALAARQLPVGGATSAVGGLYLAWLLLREWHAGHS